MNRDQSGESHELSPASRLYLAHYCDLKWRLVTFRDTHRDVGQFDVDTFTIEGSGSLVSPRLHLSICL